MTTKPIAPLPDVLTTSAKPITPHTTLLLLKNTNIPFTELPPPYNELENAPYRTVRRWILDWITETRDRLAEGM